MGVVNRTCRDCKYYDYDLTCGRPSCLLKLIHLDSLDASLCKDFESLIVPYKKSEQKEDEQMNENKLDEQLMGMYHGGIVMTAILALKCIDDGWTMEDLKAELQSTRDNYTEKLMETESGREQLEIVNEFVARMAKEDE